jgi:phospholipase A-2-activating protein
VAAGQDTAINVFSLTSTNKADPDFTLLGHTDNVCALNASSDGRTIISGSWDKCAHLIMAYSP